MAKGGRRMGAGRPKGTGKYGEKTIPLRVPESMVAAVTSMMGGMREYDVPLFSSRVAAGAPDDVDSHIDRVVTLPAHLVLSHKDTFCVQVQGDSMINAGIYDGDILVVDRSQELTNGKIVVAMVDGQATVKRFKRDKTGITLLPENDNYQPIIVTQGQTLDISGIVVGVVRKV